MEMMGYVGKGTESDIIEREEKREGNGRKPV